MQPTYRYYFVSNISKSKTRITWGESLDSIKPRNHTFLKNVSQVILNPISAISFCKNLEKQGINHKALQTLK